MSELKRKFKVGDSVTVSDMDTETGIGTNAEGKSIALKNHAAAGTVKQARNMPPGQEEVEDNFSPHYLIELEGGYEAWFAEARLS